MEELFREIEKLVREKAPDAVFAMVIINPIGDEDVDVEYYRSGTDYAMTMIGALEMLKTDVLISAYADSQEQEIEEIKEMLDEEVEE